MHFLKQHQTNELNHWSDFLSVIENFIEFFIQQQQIYIYQSCSTA